MPVTLLNTPLRTDPLTLRETQEAPWFAPVMARTLSVASSFTERAVQILNTLVSTNECRNSLDGSNLLSTRILTDDNLECFYMT